MLLHNRILKRLKDIFVTFFLWIYFTIGFVIFLMPVYIFSILLWSRRERIYQYLNSTFIRIFFVLIRLLVSNVQVTIPDEIKKIRSSILICNHRSYLDPLLMLSIFKKQKTIVKGTFFKVPIFGWMLNLSGYIPYYNDEKMDFRMYAEIDELKKFIKTGGNIFIFPEGTRSKDGNLNKFKKGAFGIARLCDAPIAVLYLNKTELLFKPGKFLFDTNIPCHISISLLKILHPEYSGNEFSIKQLMNEVEELYLDKMNKPDDYR